MTDYRSPAPPPVVEALLEVRPPGERAGLVLAAALFLIMLPYVLALPSVAGIWALPLGLALFARYGHTKIDVELRPRSGQIVLVARGTLSRRRRAFDADAVLGVHLVPIRSEGVPLAEMYDVILLLKDGTEAHVFGRPLGLAPDVARGARQKLVRLLDEARSGPPLSSSEARHLEPPPAEPSPSEEAEPDEPRARQRRG